MWDGSGHSTPPSPPSRLSASINNAERGGWGDEMSHEEAEEYFDFNVEQAYVGEKTPLYAYTFDR